MPMGDFEALEEPTTNLKTVEGGRHSKKRHSLSSSTPKVKRLRSIDSKKQDSGSVRYEDDPIAMFEDIKPLASAPDVESSHPPTLYPETSNVKVERTGTPKPVKERPSSAKRKQRISRIPSNHKVQTRSRASLHRNHAPLPSFLVSRMKNFPRLSPVMDLCRNLLVDIIKIPASAVFHVPVDPVKQNAPDYLVIIKSPMDFQTILDNLSNGSIATPNEFADQMRLVFRNAQTYNPPGHPIHLLAIALSASFEAQFASLQAAILQQSGASTKGKSPDFSAAVLSLSKHWSLFEEEVTSLTNLVSLPAPPVEVKPAVSAPKPLSSDDKKKLLELIRSLPSDRTTEVLKLLHDRSPGTHNTVNVNDVDVETLEPAVLRSLDRLVKKIHGELKKVQRRNAVSERTPRNKKRSRDVERLLKSQERLKKNLEDRDSDSYRSSSPYMRSSSRVDFDVSSETSDSEEDDAPVVLNRSIPLEEDSVSSETETDSEKEVNPFAHLVGGAEPLNETPVFSPRLSSSPFFSQTPIFHGNAPVQRRLFPPGIAH